MKKIILAIKSAFALDTNGLFYFTGRIDILEADTRTGRFTFAPRTCLCIEDALILSHQGEAQTLAALLNERKGSQIPHEWFPLTLPDRRAHYTPEETSPPS